MERMYKCLKALKKAGWEVGKTYSMEETDPAVLECVELGIIEPVPVDEEELKYARAIERFSATQAPLQAAATAQIVKAVMEQIGFETKGGPVHVKVVADEDEKTKGLGEFLQCVGIIGDSKTRPDIKAAAADTLDRVYDARPDPSFRERLAQADANQKGITLKAALAESSGITGGYTVPTQYAMDLLELEPEDTVLVGKTDEYALAGRELIMPVLNQTTPTGVVGETSYFGGVVATWTAEAATRQETEPTFKDITLVANELSGYALASRNVIFDNRVALEQRLTRLFGGAVAWYRDYAYLQGDGVGKPRGIMNAPATLTVSRATPNQVNYADIAKMIGKLLPQSMKSAQWVMQQSVLQSFLQMADSQGRYVVQPYYPNYVEGRVGGPATVRPIMMMLGLPIATTEKVSTLGTAGDLMLVDPKQYFTATRKDIEIAASDQYRFINNQIAYRFIFRGDGQPWMDAPFTLADQSTQISPFIKLV